MSINNQPEENLTVNVHKTNNISDDMSHFVKSFAKGLAILECFDAQNSQMTLTQVAQKVGITRAAARRFLLTLVELGFATQVQKKFLLTAKILNLSTGFCPDINIWQIAQMHMQQLVNNIDEACSAAILEGHEIEYVVRIGTPHRIMSVTPQAGTRFAAHLTSTGRAILAHSSPEIINDYLNNASFKKYTEFSITSRQELQEALVQTKKNGYIILNQELEIGLRSIAIPLFGTGDTPFGALTVGTHISRISENQLIQDILPQLQNCAANIQQELALHALQRPK